MQMPTIERNFGAWGVWGDAGDTTVEDLLRAVNQAQAGGPLSTVPPTNPPAIMQGSSNLIGANLRISYWYAIAARYMQGNDVGAGWGPDAATQAMGWSRWYQGQAMNLLAQRSLSPSARVSGIAVGTESLIQGTFTKAAKWLEGWTGDPRGGLRGIGAILRSLGAQTATVAQREAAGGRGTTFAPTPPEDLDPRNLLPDMPKIPFVALAVIGGVTLLGVTALVTRRR